jgi:hypothetical protein
LRYEPAREAHTRRIQRRGWLRTPRARSSCTRRARRRCTISRATTCGWIASCARTSRTHCPFKGNASYWSLAVGGKVAENAVWSYEDPYRDAEPIRGYLSFYRDKIAALYEGDEEAAFMAKGGDAVHGNPIAGWLIEEAWKARSPEALMGAFCNLLHAAGYPIARSPSSFPRCTPRIFATVLVWREDVADVRVIFEPHDILHQPRFAESPFAPIIKGAGGVRRRLEDPTASSTFRWSAT